MSEHARLAPSAAHRWIVCNGSVNLAAGVERGAPSEYAALGTAAHKLLEQCMLLDAEPHQWLGHMVNEHKVDVDMAEAVAHALDYVRSYTTRHPQARVFTEQRVHPGKNFGRDDCWGTLDIAIDNAPIELVLVDYKHGAGIFVDVENNEQLLTYAAGYVHDHYGALALLFPQGKVDQFRLVIVQPRHTGGIGPVREHVVSWQELRDFVHVLGAAAFATDASDAKLVAGDHCKFCPAAARCPELAAHALRLAQEEFSESELRLIPVDSDRFGHLLRQVPIVDAWCRAVTAQAQHFMESGGRVPGFKLVRGKRSRYWHDEATARAQLVARGFSEDQIAPRETISPAKAEDLFKEHRRGKEFRQELAALVGKRPGGLTIAKDSDPRPAVSPLAEQFNDESDGGLLA